MDSANTTAPHPSEYKPPVAPRAGKHGMTGLERPLCILDSEWTSGAPESARLLQLCIRRCEPDMTATEHLWLINPECPIEPGAEAVHGISAADVADAPVFGKVARAIAQVLAGADVGGYSIAGDIAIIERQLAEWGVRWYPEKIAIVDALRVWQVREPRTLTDAYQRFAGGGAAADSAHDAGADVEMAAAVIAAQAGGASARDLHGETQTGNLDPGGRFRVRDDGVVIYGFGKHRLLPVSDHLGYLEWLMGADFPPSTKRVAAELLRNGGKVC